MIAKRKAVGTAVKKEDKGVVIARVLSEVQRALQTAQAKLAGSGFPELDAVTITLQTVIIKTVGGTIKILIFSFGKTWEKEGSHEMVLTLKPPPAAPVSGRSLAEDLANAIVDAAEGVQKAKSGTPPLLLDTFDLSISFIVTNETSGGVEFAIEPVTFELQGKLTKKAIHKIELSFKK